MTNTRYNYLTYQTDVLNAYLDSKQHGQDCRLGQAYFNVLAEHRPDLAALVRGTEFDPFHKRGNALGSFLMWLEDRW